MIDFETVNQLDANIKIVGVGGAGGNVLASLAGRELPGVEQIAVNTDAQALRSLRGVQTIQIGREALRGLGAGAKPELGRKAAMSDWDQLKGALEGGDLVVIVAGLGGGTGTGSTPVIAEIAKSLGILTVAIITTPFSMEGKKRAEIARIGQDSLEDFADLILPIPNDAVLEEAGGNTTLLEAFKIANDVIMQATLAIVELIVRPGLINVDFADVRTVLAQSGRAAVGVGSAQKDDRARHAALAAIGSPYFKEAVLRDASALLVNVTAGYDLSIAEFQEVGDTVKRYCHKDAIIVVGTVIVPEDEAPLRVSVIATAFGRSKEKDAGAWYNTEAILEIPALLRRRPDARTPTPAASDLRVIVPESMAADSIAELIMLLSDVYESVSTDRLVVRHVTNLPPASAFDPGDQGAQERLVE